MEGSAGRACSVSYMLLFLAVSLLLSTVPGAAGHAGSVAHSCAHDRVESLIAQRERDRPPATREVEASLNGVPAAPVKERRAQTAQSAPLRVHVEHQTSGLAASVQQLLETRVIPSAIAALRRVVAVRSPVEGNLKLQRKCRTTNVGDGTCREAFPIGDCVVAAHNATFFGDSTTCDGLGTCTTLQGGPGVPNADFILYVTSRNDDLEGNTLCSSAATVAVGGWCERDLAGNGRPLCGFANYCPGQVSTISNNVEQTIDTTVHELLHGLAMSPSLFEHFVDPATGQPRGRAGVVADRTVGSGTVSAIITPRVVQEAREHYGCDQLDAMDLENSGGTGTAGSHWEQTLARGELMAGVTTVHRQLLSRLTGALLEDTGWYAVEFDNVPRIAWGRFRGCTFLSQSCGGGSAEFCDASNTQAQCEFDGRGFGSCTELSLGAPCAAVQPFTNRQCQVASNLAASDVAVVMGAAYGPGARCIPRSGTFQRVVQQGGSNVRFTLEYDGAECVNVRCTRTSGTQPWTLLVSMLGTEFTCPAGSVVDLQSLNLGFESGTFGPCPNPDDVCNSLNCPGDCSGNGVCVDGKCGCFAGKRGDDCSLDACNEVSCASDGFFSCSPVSGICLAASTPTNTPAAATTLPAGGSATGTVLMGVDYGSRCPVYADTDGDGTLGFTETEESGALSVSNRQTGSFDFTINDRTRAVSTVAMPCPNGVAAASFCTPCVGAFSRTSPTYHLRAPLPSSGSTPIVSPLTTLLVAIAAGPGSNPTVSDTAAATRVVACLGLDKPLGKLARRFTFDILQAAGQDVIAQAGSGNAQYEWHAWAEASAHNAITLIALALTDPLRSDQAGAIVVSAWAEICAPASGSAELTSDSGLTGVATAAASAARRMAQAAQKTQGSRQLAATAAQTSAAQQAAVVAARAAALNQPDEERGQTGEGLLDRLARWSVASTQQYNPLVTSTASGSSDGSALTAASTSAAIDAAANSTALPQDAEPFPAPTATTPPAAQAEGDSDADPELNAFESFFESSVTLGGLTFSGASLGVSTLALLVLAAALVWGVLGLLVSPRGKWVVIS
ncbi:unnamed protein product [Pedinophyceae sp. YPF-701]|nr:unnamed protein product [Pedinophyceae sp. YPF-701]